MLLKRLFSLCIGVTGALKLPKMLYYWCILLIKIFILMDTDNRFPGDKIDFLLYIETKMNLNTILWGQINSKSLNVSYIVVQTGCLKVIC